MLPLLKKKNEASVATLVPAWHPNFRNYQRLPDIKVVRTAFFVNGLTVFVALALAVFFGMREYELRSVKSQIDDVQALINRDKTISDQAIASYKQFQEQEKRVNDVNGFVTSRPIPSAQLQRLADTRPTNVVLDSVEINAPEGSTPSIILRGGVRGASEAANADAIRYRDGLKGDAVFGPMMDEAPRLTTSRDPSGRVRFEIVLILKNSSAKGAKK